MIVVRVSGGLGNQMFQYACALAVAIRNRSEVRIDLANFRTRQIREYALGHLAISGRPIATEALPARLRGALRVSRALHDRDNGRAQRLLGWSLLKEPSFRFWPEVLRAGDNSFLDGYWQSSRYFEGIAEVLRAEFAPLAPICEEARSIARSLRAEPSVALHVRRGDYASDPHTRDYHGLCGIEYYRRAVEMVCRETGAAKVFVFSDDPDWVRREIGHWASCTVVSGAFPLRDHEEMWLMSRCTHFVIANSSFSWWAAWLGDSAEKLVVAPRSWFNAAPQDTSDLIPGQWVRL
jgi:hypothetical protein